MNNNWFFKTSGFNTKNEKCEIFEYNNFESLIKTIDSVKKQKNECNVYAIIIEPFIAQSLVGYDEHFIKKTRKLCDNENINLIFDEVYCGWGKIFLDMFFLYKV